MKKIFSAAIFILGIYQYAHAQTPNEADATSTGLSAFPTKHEVGLYFDRNQPPIIKPWQDDGRVDWRLPGIALDGVVQFSFKPLTIRYRYVSTVFILLADGRKKELTTTDKYEPWRDARILGSAAPVFNAEAYWKKEQYKSTWFDELTDPAKPAVDKIWTDALKDCVLSNRVETMGKKKNECLRLLRAIQFEVTRIPTIKPSYVTIYIDPDAKWPQPVVRPTPPVVPPKERSSETKMIDGVKPPPPPTLEFITPPASATASSAPPKVLVENPGSTLKEPPPQPKK